MLIYQVFDTLNSKLYENLGHYLHKMNECFHNHVIEHYLTPTTNIIDITINATLDYVAITFSDPLEI